MAQAGAGEQVGGPVAAQELAPAVAGAWGQVGGLAALLAPRAAHAARMAAEAGPSSLLAAADGSMEHFAPAVERVSAAGSAARQAMNLPGHSAEHEPMAGTHAVERH